MENFQTLKIDIKGSRASDVSLRLSGGENLGHIQKLTIICEVGKQNKAIIETVLDNADIELLQGQTQLNFKTHE